MLVGLLTHYLNPSLSGANTMSSQEMSRLAVAMLERFPDFITGYLVNAKVVALCATGKIYKDAFGFYDDGELITSSEIERLEQHGSRWVIKTREGDCFVVVNCHPNGGLKSVRYLISQFKSAMLAKSNRTRH